MLITSVEPQKKNTKRFNIFLDGSFGFGADEDTVVKFRLLKGKQIAKEDLDKILFETEVGKEMERMYSLFSIRQRSEKEVRDYFKKRNFLKKVKEKEETPQLVIDATIENLKNKGMLNDKQFASSWTESRQKNKKKGVNAIKAELFQKGIDRDIIDEVIAEQTSGDNEVVLAIEALEKKIKVWRNLADLELKQKALQFLVRRGFNFQVAKEAFEKVMNKDYNND